MGSQAFIMKVISGYMLAVTAGNAAPGVADVKKLYAAVGIELSDDENKALEELVEEMTGKNAQEVLAEGLKVLETVPLGGGGGGAAPAAASGGDGGAAPAARRRPPLRRRMRWLLPLP